MNKLLLILLFFASGVVHSAEIVPIYSPYSAAHSGTPVMLRILSEANSAQSTYQFVLEFKPGGNQTIAAKSLNANSLAIISAVFVENVESGKLNFNDYVPVHALGNACWAVLVNKELEGEILAGGVGFGNSTHLTSLALADKYKFKVRYIVFKSGNDALINMAGNHGVNFVIDRYEAFESMAQMNSNLRMFAASCPVRLPQQPKIKTLKELGINAPYIFNITVAHKDMPETKRQAISVILNSAQDRIGADEIFKLSAFRPPKFDNMSTENFYHDSYNLVKNLQQKYRKQIDSEKQ
jgi:tripartite-type tricarboxylate transporter receptor subunit TctC